MLEQLLLRLGRRRPLPARRPDPHAMPDLPQIPVVDAGAAFPRQTLEADIARAHALFDAATQGVPRPVLAGLDRVSRRWLVRQRNACLHEIDEVAARMGRPGSHFLSVSYEWGCTVAVGPSPDGASARLTRTLDWFTPGLGRYVMAARVAGRAGPFVTLTWPGFVGALQAMAPGRFSAALNQAPLRRYCGGLYPLDWAAGKVRFWRTRHEPPLHLLRRVMDGARDYGAARAMLEETPIAAPATFCLAGIAPHEACVIEREETRAWVREVLVPRQEVWVAEVEGRILGMAALGEEMLQQLYIHPDYQGQGIGDALFRLATERYPAGFTLYAFQRNARARAFYEARGCVAVAFGDGSGNEEGEPDVLYAWMK